MADVDLNVVENLDDASEFELKHFPTLTVEGGKATVEVGKAVPHPQQEDHWIDGIHLYLDGEQVESVELSPEDQHVVEFDVDGKSGELHAVADCNLHGAWKSHSVAL